jgi:hypothetical protein
MPHLKTFAIGMIAGLVGVAIAFRVDALRSIVTNNKVA